MAGTRCISRALIAAVLLLVACREQRERNAPRDRSWRYSPELAECARKVTAQKAALANDRLADSETFAKHPAEEQLSGPPAGADLDSNRYARMFRTRLAEELAAHGVNFAGVYSLVSVGMTGWGDNWYIVDRRDGKVTLFPYYAAFLEFRADSNLVIMNPRHAIEEALGEQVVDCRFLNQQELTSLRSFYFLWQDGRLVRIGPKEIEPPRNRFWDQYLPPLTTTAAAR